MPWSTVSNIKGPAGNAADTAAVTNAATSKATPVDADALPLVDSAASFGLKKLTWANLKATLKDYFDSLTTTLSNKTIAAPALTGTTKAASGSVVELYATADQATNFEKLALSYSGGFAMVSSDNGGTGTARTLQLRGGNGRRINIGGVSVSNAFVELPDGTSGANITGVRLNAGTWTATSGVNAMASITPTINQSSTAGYTALLINPTETATGSGTKRLIDAQVGGTSRLTVDNTGVVNAVGGLQVNGVAVPTISSVSTLTQKTLTNPTINAYTEGFVAVGTVTTAHTLDITAGTVVTATLTASTACTFTMPTAAAGKSFTLMLRQAAATGNGTATFTGVKWGTSGAPTITATAGKMDILSFFSDGTNWYGSVAQGYTP